eukprot:Phypoly_transcript_16503.p1 GENE.Phypoly_transcript_16503~~Phypoly_transcript_16503.p1  ORF type:complete len:101 (+),score=5.36 Phypoly_transcript_16503:235-537(+)
MSFAISCSDSCSAQVSLVARAGSSWYTNGVNNQIYDVSIQNDGTSQITSLNLHIATSGMLLILLLSSRDTHNITLILSSRVTFLLFLHYISLRYSHLIVN